MFGMVTGKDQPGLLMPGVQKFLLCKTGRQKATWKHTQRLLQGSEIQCKETSDTHLKQTLTKVNIKNNTTDNTHWSLFCSLSDEQKAWLGNVRVPLQDILLGGIMSNTSKGNRS